MWRVTGRLYDDVIVLDTFRGGGVDELRDRSEEFVSEGAADAAVAELDCVSHERISVSRKAYKLGVDVDGRHVVDEHAEAHTVTASVLEEVAEAGRLACSQES